MLKKIGEVPRPCTNPEHNPPSHIVLSPGIYEHTCPGCGSTLQFVVNGYSLYKSDSFKMAEETGRRVGW